MLFNCLQCGKAISTKFEKCPYCQTNVVEVAHQITGIVARERKPLKSQKSFEGTIVSFTSRAG